MLFSLLNLMHYNEETNVFDVLQYIVFNIFCYNAIFRSPLIYFAVFFCSSIKYGFKVSMKTVLGVWVLIGYCLLYLFTAVVLSQQSVVYEYMSMKHFVGVLVIIGALAAFEILSMSMYIYIRKLVIKKTLVERFNEPPAAPPLVVRQYNS